MISKKIFAANGTNTRFLSEFIIASEQFTRVYVYIYDNTLDANGTEDVLQNESLPWSYPSNLYRRGANAPNSADDLITIDKWSLVTNSILFSTAPLAPATVWIEVATTSEEFGDTLIQPQVARAEEAAAEALLSETNAKASEIAVAADLVSTNADVVLTGLDVDTTNADVILADADVVLTHADVVITNDDVVSTNADVVLTGLDVDTTNADVVITNADVVITNADVVLTNADVVASQLTAWEAEAEKMTSESFAVEATDTNVKTYVSDGDGTFTPTTTANYSSTHWAMKSAMSASLAEGSLYGALVAITANLTGSHPIPASGVVDTRGYMYCDGSAIPGGQVLSGTLPNLTDGRFLRGSTTAGSVGGSNEFTLIEANLPAHTHTADHSHTASSNSTGAHTHSGQIHNGTSGYSHNGSNNAWNFTSVQNMGSAGSHSHTITVNSASVTTSSVGSDTAVSHIPQYVNVVYLLKVM